MPIVWLSTSCIPGSVVPVTNRESISKRAINVQPSATLAISAKAKALKAQGVPVIGFGAGEPDFSTPGHIVEAAIAAIADPASHKYSPVPGLPALREAIAAKTYRDSGFHVDPASVVVTNGGKQAVYQTCQVLLDHGDEVLLPAPYWVTYPSAIELAGGVPVPIETDAASKFTVSVDALEAATTERTKMLVFVSPSNPTGSVYTLEQIREIGEWAVERGIWVMSDEIYEHLVYGANSFHSMPVVVPELADRCVVVNGVAKTYAMTGWRVGWMIGPDVVARGATRIQSHLTSNVNNAAQMGALAAVTGPFDAVEDMRTVFDRRRRTMYKMLNEIQGVECVEPQGAFYAFPDLSGLLNRPIGGRTAASTLELAEIILDDANVAIVPGEAFGAPGYARLSFALGDDDLVEGLARIEELVSSP